MATKTSETAAKPDKSTTLELDEAHARTRDQLTAMNKSKRNRLQRYRERHPRIDYYPAPDVLALLLHHSGITGEPCLAGVLDGLIRVAHRAISGSGGKK